MATRSFSAMTYVVRIQYQLVDPRVQVIGGSLLLRLVLVAFSMPLQ